MVCKCHYYYHICIGSIRNPVIDPTIRTSVIFNQSRTSRGAVSLRLVPITCFPALSRSFVALGVTFFPRLPPLSFFPRLERFSLLRDSRLLCFTFVQKLTQLKQLQPMSVVESCIASRAKPPERKPRLSRHSV